MEDNLKTKRDSLEGLSLSVANHYNNEPLTKTFILRLVHSRVGYRARISIFNPDHERLGESQECRPNESQFLKWFAPILTLDTLTAKGFDYTPGGPL
jgi:hypothetical protein